MYFKIQILMFHTFVLLRLSETKRFSVETREMAKLIEEGRTQYNLIEQRSSIPQYGLCWKSSVVFLHEGCRRLTENAQIDIALRFTDCFLKMSGHKIYECEKHSVREDCIKNMSDRAFNAFTEFYTHVYNICFFLQSQIWHEETEKTIDRLSTSSAHVTKQLEEAEVVQAVLLQQQRDSMSVQQELLTNGLSLREILHTSQDNLHAIMQEFRTSTLEQKRILFEVFDRLTSLQAWAIGEISWFDTVVFYISSIMVSYVVTATPKTQEARIWIFLIITVNAVIERIVVRQFLEDDVDHVNKSLYWWIWQCRKVMLAVCVVWIGVTVYQYCDYNAVNHQLLLQIQKQNTEVINCLGKMRNTDNDPNPKLILENKLLEVNEAPLLEPAKLAEGISKLTRMKVRVKSKSPSPTLSSVSGNTNKSDASIEKRQLPRRLMEIQTPRVQYNLRSMRGTPPSIGKETV
jgi:hypothetical protein